MKAILFLAVLALAAQAQTPVHEFYHSFISNLHMDAATQNQVLNDGLECLNYALTTVASSVENIQHDLASENFITAIREAITSIQTLEHEVFPRCVGAYIEIASYIQQHSNHRYVNSLNKMQLFQAKLVQLFSQVVFNAALEANPEQIAHDLAVLVNTASGLVETELPYTLDFEYEKFVPFNGEKFVREFTKGFFTTLGYKNVTQINATAECTLGLSMNVNGLFTNPALHRGDDLSRVEAFLNGVMNVTGAWERCKRLPMVDFRYASKLVSLLKEEAGQVYLTTIYNNLMHLPSLTQAQINMSVYLLEGQYEIVGQLYASAIKTTFEKILF